MAAGDITSRALGVASALPEDNPAGGVFYVEIGAYAVSGDTVTVSNGRYGPIGVVVQREWFSDPIRWQSLFYGP